MSTKPPSGSRLEAAGTSAAGLLDRLRLPDGVLPLPVDLEAAARLAGLRVVTVEGGLAGRVVRNTSGVPVSGILDFESGRIYVDERESAQRRRFTIAHEIAHEVLGHEARLGGELHVVYSHESGEGEGERGAAGSRPGAESEADVFAAALLVPPSELARLVGEVGPSVPLLAHRFDVSCAAMRRHLVPWLPAVEDLG